MIELVSQSNSRPGSSYPDQPHVLLVVDQFPRSLGGGERVALRLASLLPQYGFRASILTFFVHPESSVGGFVPCPLYLLPLRRTYDLTALKAALSLRAFLRDQKVLVVQTFFESSDIWAGTVAKLFSQTKLIWSRRDLGILRTRKHGLAYRALAALPDAVFAVSEQVREYCIQVDGIRPEKVYTVYNGIDFLPCSNAQTEKIKGQHQIVTVGNIRRVKGHDILVRAAAIVARQFPNVVYRIAGEVLEQDYFDELQALIKKLGLGEKFDFAGNVTDLPAFLGSADIFVLPSRSEGFSNALIEAMAAGLPVIATNVGGNAEAIGEDAGGFIVPSENPEKLAEAIIKLLADSELARNIGQSGRAIALRRFTTEAMMQQTVDVYRKLLSSRGPGNGQ